jgi:hypothetical protein
MNVRRVRYHLATKFDKWYKSIEDDQLKALVAKNTIITGGSIASLLQGENVKDYDLYFSSHDVTLAVANYYIDLFNKQLKDAGLSKKIKPKVVDKNGRITINTKSVGITSGLTDDDDYRYFEQTNDESADEFLMETFHGIITEADELDSNILRGKMGLTDDYKPVFLSDNAITLTGKVQLIIRFFGSPEEIHSNFDYVHCTNYWQSSDRKLYTNHDAVESILTHDLRYVGSKYPICSIIRLRRLLRKGWFANAGQILKICYQISELDLNDYKVLEEQLVGVDTAYFYELLQLLKREGYSDKSIDSTYICSLIDRMF